MSSVLSSNRHLNMHFYSIVGILVVLFCHDVSGTLTSYPYDLAALVGSTVRFNCSAELGENDTAQPFNWQYNAMSTVPIRIVQDCQVNPAYSHKFAVEPIGDNDCGLVIMNTNMQSAGTYTCQHGFDQASGVLVMLNANSSCSYSPSTDLIAGDMIHIFCVLNYNGSSMPYMVWHAADTGNPITNDTTNRLHTQVNSYIDVPVYPPTSRPITCTTYFDPPIEFVYVWTLPTIYVQYFVTKAIATVHVVYFENATITCEADGYPAPTYVWTDKDTGDSFTGATVTLGVTGFYQYTCNATNVIRGEEQSVQYESSVNITQVLPPTLPTTATTTAVVTTAEDAAETTSEPTTTMTTTTTTSPPTTESLDRCGNLMFTAPSNAVTKPAGWDPVCYITISETSLLSTPCRDLIADLPPDFADWNDLIARGGNFGCAGSTRTDYSDADVACFDDYQQEMTLDSCTVCQRLYVCIRLP